MVVPAVHAKQVKHYESGAGHEGWGIGLYLRASSSQPRGMLPVAVHALGLLPIYFTSDAVQGDTLGACFNREVPLWDMQAKPVVG